MNPTSNLKPRVLIIEDEAPMRIALTDFLKSDGYRVLTASDGEAGLKQAQHEKPDIILLDVMMPKLDGFSLCRELRRIGNQVPILMLTAKGQTDDRVAGLDAGSDDYLVKPFSSKELMARIRSLLRRAKHQQQPIGQIQIGEITVNFQQQRVTKKGQSVHLTAKELSMVQIMAERRNQPISREDFLDAVWGFAAFPTTRTVDNHMATIRSKLEPNPAKQMYFITIHGIGYQLNVEEEWK